jgi:hypothetical protein
VNPQRAERLILVFLRRTATAREKRREQKQQIDVETASASYHSGCYKDETRNKCKDSYGTTAQQSRKTETPPKLSQAQKDQHQNQEGCEIQAGQGTLINSTGKVQNRSY